ncbi:S-layer homology domain-containing protein [Lysinibacillus telephonicus]|uniref:S-layer homology domain-containing protein n=1 Tax=Lysinibacillus telephonicus TaxID=1714840 RepID=UPI003BA16581
MKKLTTILISLSLMLSTILPISVSASEDDIQDISEHNVDLGNQENSTEDNSIENSADESQSATDAVEANDEGNTEANSSQSTEDSATISPQQPQHITVSQKLADIPNSFWAKNEVMQLVEMGVINGYPDGEFRPALEINRGQAANLFAGALQLPAAPYQPIFSDVSSKSSFLQGVMRTFASGIFQGKPDGRFGVADGLTREQMATTIVRAFELQDTGEQITFKDWNRISPSHRENVKILAQHGITTGKEDGTFDPKTTVNRVTFTVMLYRALVATNRIPENQFTITAGEASSNFALNRKEANFAKVTGGTNPLYIRANTTIVNKGATTTSYGVAKDTVYNYSIGLDGATLEVTVRHLNNGDEFVFTTLENPSNSKVTVDLFQKEEGISNSRLYRYDRYPLKKNPDDVFGYDSSSYQTGLLRFVNRDGAVSGERMVGQAYRSKQLVQTYKDGGRSLMRDLISEYEALSYNKLGTDMYVFYTLTSNGKDIVDTWYMDSSKQLFNSDENMNSWMVETAQNYKKRNKWYTAEGPFNKMATTTEPMPSSYQGFGRNLLLVKEDRALVLYKEQGDRYFENLVNNSFVSLTKFKGNKKYWETEVTSTYLKGLYGIHAPFIDTRFNEQIALFYYNSGAMFGVPNYKEPLRNYADLLVSREAAGHIIRVDRDSYYIADYFPLVQEVTTHSSMNHMLGGMNLLLIAYKEFGDAKYLKTATAIQSAIAKEKNKWIRSNGDIWYRVNKQGEFRGEDYQHLTLEDLINAYRLWKDIDTTYLPVLEEMIASKAGYLSRNNYGYTLKIKNGLEEIGMSKYLPKGPMYTDAL